MDSLLGLPLSDALDRLKEKGLPLPGVVITEDPKGHAGGTLRVVRANEGSLVAAAFHDGDPVPRQAATASVNRSEQP